jgi:hypothetical protein
MATVRSLRAWLFLPMTCAATTPALWLAVRHTLTRGRGRPLAVRIMATIPMTSAAMTLAWLAVRHMLTRGYGRPVAVMMMIRRVQLDKPTRGYGRLLTGWTMATATLVGATTWATVEIVLRLDLMRGPTPLAMMISGLLTVVMALLHLWLWFLPMTSAATTLASGLAVRHMLTRGYGRPSAVMTMLRRFQQAWWLRENVLRLVLRRGPTPLAMMISGLLTVVMALLHLSL